MNLFLDNWIECCPVNTTKLGGNTIPLNRLLAQEGEIINEKIQYLLQRTKQTALEKMGEGREALVYYHFVYIYWITVWIIGWIVFKSKESNCILNYIDVWDDTFLLWYQAMLSDPPQQNEQNPKYI